MNIAEIQKQMKRPEGSVSFLFTDDVEQSRINILNFSTGAHIFILERTEEYELRYYYSSTGAGTKVASIDIKEIASSPKLFIALTWSPQEINLYVGDKANNGELIHAKGSESKKRFMADRVGNIIQFGDDDIKIMDEKIIVNGEVMLSATAINAWNSTIEAVGIIKNSKSDDGFLHEVAICNVCISVLVTGMEAYCKKRFLELEEEGIVPNMTDLCSSFFTKRELEVNICELASKEATENGLTLLAKIVIDKRINFQNYDKCKNAYSKGYGIRFTEIGVDCSNIDFLKKIINFRHKIIHVSAISTILNELEMHKEEPIFANKNLLEKSIQCFNDFITKLHTATLALR